MKKARIILSPDAEEVYNYLNKEASNSKTERVILKAFNKKKELVKNNIHYGQPIAKSKIPDTYKKTYGVTNLFWVDLPNAWRMLYTLTNDEAQVEIIAFVLDIFDHKTYEKKMGYKKS